MSVSCTLESLWTNATSGHLSECQQQEIATRATADYYALDENGQRVSCGDPSMAGNTECMKLQQGNQEIVQQVSPTAVEDKCAVQLPVIGCIETWDKFLSGVVWIGLVVVGLVALIALAPYVRAFKE